MEMDRHPSSRPRLRLTYHSSQSFVAEHPFLCLQEARHVLWQLPAAAEMVVPQEAVAEEVEDLQSRLAGEVEVEAEAAQA